MKAGGFYVKFILKDERVITSQLSENTLEIVKESLFSQLSVGKKVKNQGSHSDTVLDI